MIKMMTAHTSTRTGKTTYHVYYASGKRVKVLSQNDNWPMSIVKFFTADDTVRVEDRIIGEGKYSARYERFERA